MYKIIITLFLTISLQANDIYLKKYTNQQTSVNCETLKKDSIEAAYKSTEVKTESQKMQFKDLADNLYNQNARCVNGVTQRLFGSQEESKTKSFYMHNKMRK